MQNFTAQHSTAQHSTAQHSTAQHSTSNCLFFSFKNKFLTIFSYIFLVLGIINCMGMSARADNTETPLTTITATGQEQASYSTANVATVSFSYTAGGSSSYLANWGWWGYGWTATVNAAEGYTITKCIFYDDANRTATDSEAPFVVETTEQDKTPRINGTPIDGGNMQSKGIKKIEVYGIFNVESVSLDKTSITLLSGDTVKLTATVSPDNATYKTVTWSSSNTAVATVNQSGDVTGVSAGTATITATATNGTTQTTDDKTATCEITVVKNPTITFDANGGTGSMNAQVVSYDVATALTVNAFTRTGYTFSSWNTLANGSETSYTDGASIKISADKTLYAQWTTVNYVISYDLDGGTNSTANPAIYTITSPDITLQAPAKTGYTFAKWTSGDVELTKIATGSSGNINLKANWTANTYTVKFNSNGGTGSMSDLTLTYDVEQALSNNAFTRAGYTFNGWKDNENNKTYNGGASVKNLTATNGAVINLYAQWKVNQYTLTFNTDGGSTISAITQDYGTAVTAPANPAKEGYTFNGWDKEIPSTMPAENLTFNAKWTENEKTPAPAPEEPQQEEPTNNPEEPTEENSESQTANAEQVSSMDNEELKRTFEDKTEITLTGNINNESLSKVIEKITTVTEVKTLDLSKLENVTEVKLSDTVKVESLTVSGNETITRVEVQNNTSLKSINLSSSKVETVDAKGCSELTEVVLTSCDELQKLDVSETPITKLDTSNCEKLSSINCNSCDISELNIDGCKKLSDLNCANNSLSRLDVSRFSLNSLECEHQRIKNFRRTSAFNILDILFRRIEAFIASDANTEDNTGDIANVKDITGVDENGNEFSPISCDEETGEVVFSKAPAAVKYNYTTGFNGKVMDVTVETGTETQDNNSVSGSGGGCNFSSLGAALMSLFIPMMKRLEIRN